MRNCTSVNSSQCLGVGCMRNVKKKDVISPKQFLCFLVTLANKCNQVCGGGKLGPRGGTDNPDNDCWQLNKPPV